MSEPSPDHHAADHDRETAHGGSQQRPGALDGIRVLDLTQVMSGPFCTMILADLGADVIKIENPEHGDQTRKSWGYSVIGEDSRAFLSLNRNKRSVVLDLKDDGDHRTFLELVRTADVVVENFRPGVAERLGVDYPTLRAVNDRIIYGSISGFGRTGPYATHPGYDLIAQAMTGIMSVMGQPGEPPVKSAIPVGDLGAGLFCCIGILGALMSRQRTGTGQYVETSLFEAALALSVWESTEFWSTGKAPEPLGSANRMSAPYQALATADGYLTIGANNEKLWRLLCGVLELPELLDDPRFVDNNHRMDHREELAARLEKRLADRTTDEWVTALLAAGVPAGPIRDYAYVLTEDPHVRARNMVTTYDHPVEGETSVLNSPITLSDTPVREAASAPLLGEHTADVLAELAVHSGASAAPRSAKQAEERIGE
ncbi:CaiB/BaiF CoA transferase family protein [Microlunatus soli]|uniref:Formyl-CoA transferase n=1 Tax=Microlunatus soli TaxID=630515 RepID=A0A1H1ZNV0_9ACTN|nr:CoA transferase [Microlunatus soli]SDT35481.1 formyl-CoA transferase [Microlunatus soli]